MKEIAETIQKIASLLSERGSVTLSGVEVQPGDPSWFMVRYERTHRGELNLKLEIQWVEGAGTAATETGRELTIE